MSEQVDVTALVRKYAVLKAHDWVNPARTEELECDLHALGRERDELRLRLGELPDRSENWAELLALLDGNEREGEILGKVHVHAANAGTLIGERHLEEYNAREQAEEALSELTAMAEGQSEALKEARQVADKELERGNNLLARAEKAEAERDALREALKPLEWSRKRHTSTGSRAGGRNCRACPRCFGVHPDDQHDDWEEKQYGHAPMCALRAALRGEGAPK